MEVCVRGFHVYKAIWQAVECGRERGNRVDCYIVAVVKDETVVRHVTQKISQMCSWRQWALRVWQLLVAGLKYCSNAMCGRYRCLVDWRPKQCNNLIICGFNFRGCLSTVKTVKISPPQIIPAKWYCINRHMTREALQSHCLSACIGLEYLCVKWAYFWVKYHTPLYLTSHLSVSRDSVVPLLRTDWFF